MRNSIEAEKRFDLVRMKKLHYAHLQDQDLVINSKPGKGKHLDDFFFRFFFQIFFFRLCPLHVKQSSAIVFMFAMVAVPV